VTPEPPATQPDPVPTRGERIGAVLLYGGLFALVATCIILFETDPTAQPSPKLPWRRGSLSSKDLAVIFMVLTGLSALCTLAWGLLRRRHRRRQHPTGRGWRRTARVVLTLMVLVSGFNYFYGRQGLYASQYSHRWDTFHYLLGPRYYAELDYADLYACALEDLSKRDIPDKTPVRDLRNYHMSTAGKIREQNLCADKFTPQRRERWRQDLDVYTANRGYRVLRDALGDRGYNGTPFHSAIAGYIAERIPLTQATHPLVSLLDISTLCLMCGAAVWGFGWEVGLLFALFFFTNAADRFGIIGSSFFRYQWMVTLGLGLAALRRRRHALAGVLMTLSTVLSIFPFVFSVGVLVKGVADTVRQRRVPIPLRRFVIAAFITGVLGLGIGAIPARGLDNYRGWIADMELHNVERFQGFGTGLKFPFIYRGGTTAKNDRVSERTRKKWFHQVRPWYRALATLVVGMGLFVAARTDDDVEAATVLGFTLFFCLLGTVGYYFAVAAVLILGLHRRVRTVGGTVLVSLLFVTSLLTHWALYANNYYRFMYNTVLSTGWSVWLILLLCWLVYKLRFKVRFKRRLKTG